MGGEADGTDTYIRTVRGGRRWAGMLSVLSMTEGHLEEEEEDVHHDHDEEDNPHDNLPLSKAELRKVRPLWCSRYSLFIIVIWAWLTHGHHTLMKLGLNL